MAIDNSLARHHKRMWRQTHITNPIFEDMTAEEIDEYMDGKIQAEEDSYRDDS